jgi:hypothetical protein
MFSPDLSDIIGVMVIASAKRKRVKKRDIPYQYPDTDGALIPSNCKKEDAQVNMDKKDIPQLVINSGL